MDKVIPLAPSPAGPISALPPEAPLAMPRQSLRDVPPSRALPESDVRSVPLRRMFVFGSAVALTAVAAWQMYQVLKVGGLTPLEAIILALFTILFAWVSLSFVSAVIGSFVLLFGRPLALGIDLNAPLPPLDTRTALLLPTYNEDPDRVFARLQAIYESVAATGRLAHFDFFILSDSTDARTWVLEEAAFLRLRREVGAEQLFYRHRVKNVERKAGNIADWVTRFGAAYEAMIVLDADSLMDGETVVRLAGAIERNPHVGLIQTLPVLLNARTLFSRLQQFAGRVYGPILAAGIAWWHGSESNYWGHNAIIRVAAFASSAGLPVLSGRHVFGGHILSHDFVEAALMRRAGWAIRMSPELGGSYEESPPTLTEYAVRDRRWCQGNLQHAGVLPARGLHWISRLHLLTGIGSYITAPLWFVFLLVGILISLQAEFIRPEYFPKGATLFPQWPAQDPIRAAYVFGGTMGLLLLPKLFGWIAASARSQSRYGMGGIVRGFISLCLEIIISALMAPIMMTKQSRAVIEILLGRDAGWSAQRRDGSATAFSEAMRRYGTQTLLGIVFALVAYAVSPSLLLWMLPVVAGLVLAVPLVVLTGSTRVGDELRARGLLLTAEERHPPAVLARATELAELPERPNEQDILQLLRNDELRQLHVHMLGSPPARRKGEVNLSLLVGLAKLEDAMDPEDALALLDSKELFALLAHRTSAEKLFCKLSVAERVPFAADEGYRSAGR
jgi:membrane glycosyltransferase